MRIDNGPRSESACGGQESDVPYFPEVPCASQSVIALPFSLRDAAAVRGRAAGTLWVALWFGVLYLVVRPWLDLGGLVGERLRWCEGFVLAAGLLVGHTVGAYGRDVSGPGRGRSHATLLRFVLLGPATLTAIVLVALRAIGLEEPIGIVLTAFLATWAGFDLGFGALPLIQGRCYRFRGPIDPAPADESEIDREDDFPWWHGL